MRMKSPLLGEILGFSFRFVFNWHDRRFSRAETRAYCVYPQCVFICAHLCCMCAHTVYSRSLQLRAVLHYADVFTYMPLGVSLCRIMDVSCFYIQGLFKGALRSCVIQLPSLLIQWENLKCAKLQSSSSVNIKQIKCNSNDTYLFLFYLLKYVFTC